MTEQDQPSLRENSLTAVARGLDMMDAPTSPQNFAVEVAATSPIDHKLVSRPLLWLTWFAVAAITHFVVDGRTSDKLDILVAHMLGSVVCYFGIGGVLFLLTCWFFRKSRNHIFACLFVGMALSAIIQYEGEQLVRNGERQTPPTAPAKFASTLPTTTPKPVVHAFQWKPVGSEYSVVFPGTPKIAEVKGVGDSGEMTVLQATHFGDVGVEQAEFLPLVLTEPVTKQIATDAIINWAHSAGMESYEVQFNDSNPNDLIATFKCSKRISMTGGEVMMRLLGERHWGRRSLICLIISAPALRSPTPEGMAFLESIRQQQ